MRDLERHVSELLREPSTQRLESELAALAPDLASTAPAKALRAEVLRRRGEVREAATLYAEALNACPSLHAAYHGAALACIASGDPAGARSLWTTLVERAPDDPVARYQIGLTWHDERNFGEAARWYAAQLAIHPASFQATYNLGLVHLETGDAAGAATLLARAAGLDPNHAGAWAALGTALLRSGNAPAAAQAWLKAHALDPTNVRSLAQAADAFGQASELPAAIATLARALDIEPGSASMRWAMAAHSSSLGLHADAIRCQREALALDPNDWRGHSALLLELQYDIDAVSRAELATEHRRWASTHASTARSIDIPRRPRLPADRLRVAYVSSRFGHGPLASHFLPVLAAHDRRRLHVTLYSAYAQHDDATVKMRAACDLWRDLPVDDAAAAAMIAADRQDILIDLAGHTPGHRLLVFARRPARVQATWLDYFDTTGVREIDYLLTDAIHTPAREAPFFSERIVWLPHCRFVYAPIVSPVHSPAPSDDNGYVTFGSFNRHAKLTARTLAVWKQVLDAVPGSRLELRASAYRGAGTVAWLRERWSRAGLPIDRIKLQPYVPIAEAIDAYRGIDVALDTFPYNGGVTTCDALAMGVPVIALAGERMIARQSAALLHAGGHPEWIAQTEDEYVRIAARVALDPARTTLRRDLVDTLPGSALCRVDEFTAALERAYRMLDERGPRTGDTVGEPLAIDG